MLGQNELLTRINSFTFDTLPHSILLLGDRGSGHFEVCEYIAEKFNLQLIRVEDINLDYINEICLNTVPSLYVIDTLTLTDREQNIILKLYEEPSIYTYVVLLGESTYNILETIVTRSYIFHTVKYSLEQLEPLAKEKELTLKICNTPGQIEIANQTNMESLYNLCSLILSSMSKAAYFNALSISNKINFKDEPDKYDLFLFIKMLGYVLLENRNLVMYSELCSFNKRVWQVLNKKQFFENFITNLWEISRDERYRPEN